MRYFIPFILFTACTPQEVKLAEDFVQGEATVAEQMLQDSMPNPAVPKPKIQAIKK
jgi:hypothetical protein